jgi:hypothetical protein
LPLQLLLQLAHLQHQLPVRSSCSNRACSADVQCQQ